MASALHLLRMAEEHHRRMVSLAEQLDWDGVNREWEGIYPALLELQKMSLNELPASEGGEVRHLIEGLLDCQKQLSSKIIPWMEQVRPLLQSFKEYPLPAHAAKNVGNP
jgi:hypothetical protein